MVGVVANLTSAQFSEAVLALKGGDKSVLDTVATLLKNSNESET